jgi:hypothetical protein
MAFPNDPISLPDWTAGGVTPAIMTSKVTDRLNALRVVASGQAYRRTRTTAISSALTAGSTTLIAAWPTLSFSAGSFGSYSNSGGTAGQFTFSLAGMYTWEMPVQWPNDTAYKVSARLLINGSLSPDGDNIDEAYVLAVGADPTILHRGTYPVQVGDVWQMGLAANIDRTANTITPQSWSILKVA